MKKGLCFTALTAVIAGSLIFSSSNAAPVWASAAKQWDSPAPLSSVLHKGSAKGAGLIKEPLERIDGIMGTAVENGTAPGIVAFAAKSGHIVKHEAYGHSALYTDDQGTQMDNPIEMKEDTIFDVASISKIFTTTAAMILYEDGLFHLDDPVALHLPEFAANGKEQVTIRQLMTHTSGFTSWVPLYEQKGGRDERIEYALNYPLANLPGENYTYSDLNLITLGALIEKFSGMRLDEFIRQELTRPLGMKDTMYNPPASLKERIAATEYQPAIGRGLVWGEVHDENAWSLDGVAGHAGVFSTALDLGKLAHMFLNDGKYGGQRILEKETVRMLETNQIPEFPGNDHGLGWELNQGWYMDALSDSESFGHTGYTGTSIVINRDNHTTAILLTNRVHPSRTTVSTNFIRRDFARAVADSIPAPLNKKDKAWFSGYGDNLNRSMTVATRGASSLTFDAWNRIEQDSDYGYIETSVDGEDWSESILQLTGDSEEWTAHEVALPEGTQFVRFRYVTDASVNGRGWYIRNIEAGNEKTQPLAEQNGWTLRNY